MSLFLDRIKTPSFLFFSLLIVGFLLRSYAFQQNIEFNSDFGRDSLFAMRILEEKPTLLGAQSSTGGFYLGPLYFYGLAAVYFVFGYAPQIGNLVFIGLNIWAAYLVYKFLKEQVSEAAGLFGLTLFTFSPLLITAARGATHVPMLPLITVLSVMALYRALTERKMPWHIVSGLAFGLFFHVHFTALLLVPGYLLAVWLWGGKQWRERLTAVAYHISGVVLMLSPLILFDVRHGFITSQAFFDYLFASATGGEITANFDHWTTSEKVFNLLKMFTQQTWLQLLLVAGAVLGLKKSWPKKFSLTVPNLVGLLFGSMFVFYLLYSGYLYAYYLVIPVTLGVLVFAILLAATPQRWLSLLVVSLMALSTLLATKGGYQPIFRTIQHLSAITHEIERHIDATQPASFTIFKDSRDGLTSLGYEYRFLLQRDGYVPARELEYHLAEVMYVIQEDGDADPLTLGNWEVTQFAPTEAEELTTLELQGKTIRIFVLY